MIHLLVGPDRYLVEREIARITAAADPDGTNTSRFEKSRSISEVANAVATTGFFGTGRVVVAEGVIAQFRGSAKSRKAELAELESLFASVAPGNVLILVDPDLQTIPVDVRKLAGPDAIHFGGAVPRGSDLQKWVIEQVDAAGGAILPRTVNLLLNRLFPGDWQQVNKNPAYDQPPDLHHLINEILKLVTYADGAEITPADIEELVPSETADEIFSLLGAVIQGRAGDAFPHLADQQSDDEAAARVLGQVAANAEFGQITAGFRGDAALQSAAKELGGVSPGRLAAIQRNFGRRDPVKFAELVLESDRRLKTGVTRGLVDQLHEVIVRQAAKTRSQG